MKARNHDLRAPIFTASWDLCAWLLKKARAQPHDPLAHSLAVEALHLLDTVTMALKNIDCGNALVDADLILIRLRLRLRLAVETALLNDRQGQYALRQATTLAANSVGGKKAWRRRREYRCGGTSSLAPIRTQAVGNRHDV